MSLRRATSRWPGSPTRLLLGLLAVVLASPACRQGEPAELTLTLLATSDFHGSLISERRDPETERPLGGAAAIAATVAREKRTNPGATLLLDAGDSFHGTALSNLTEGRATIDYMNLVGFDAMAIGNHSFDWGVPVLRERMAQADFPLLVANLVEKETGELPSWARPYHVLERQGVRIAVLGLLSTDTPRTTMPDNVAAFDVLDPAPVANRWIAELVPARADLAVLLCHLGLLYDPETGQPGSELVVMTESVRGAAAIVAGHTHQTFAGELHGIPVVQAGAWGEYLGRIDLVFDRGRRQVTASEVRLVEVFADALPPDAAVARLVERYSEAAGETMREVIGHAASAIERDPERECTMGNLFTDAIRRQIGTSFVFQNPFGLRDSLAAGPITREDVYRIMPFDNTIVVVRMSGREIRELLEQAAEKINLLYVSGLRYSIDLTRPAGSRITVSPPLDDEAVYEVAVNSFLAQGGDGLSILAGRPEARDTGILLRDALSGWIRLETRQGRAVASEVDGRIVIRR